jgi:membrane protease YdiL (CAAX protease family)
MIPGAPYTAIALLATTASPAAPGRIEWILTIIDHVLSGVALLLAAGVAARWMVPPRRDPLETAPLRPNRLHEGLVFLVVFAYLIAAALLQAVVELVVGTAESVLATLLIGSAAQLVGIVACLAVAARTFDSGLRGYVIGERVERAGSWPVSAVVMTLAAIGLCPVVRDVTVEVIQLFDPDHTFDAHPTIRALHDASQPFGVHVALWGGAVVVAPLAEEFFFRGLLQTLLVKMLRSRWVAILVASLAFGLVHFSQPHAVPALVALGFLIGYAYERSGSLVPPVLIHAVFNLKTLVWDALIGPVP